MAWSNRPNSRQIGTVLVAGLAVGGCRIGPRGTDPAPSGEPSPGQPATHAAPPATDDNPFRDAGPRHPADPAVRALAMQFNVVRIDVPAGTLSTSEKIWNHLDEEALPLAVNQRLQRNGFRVGLGGEGSWPPIKAILDAAGDIQVRRGDYTVHNPYPLSLELDEHRRDQTVFWFHRDSGSPAGQSFPNSRNVFRIEHAVNPDDLAQIILEVIPEVRQGPARKQWVATEGGVQAVPSYGGRLMREVSFRVTLPTGQFLVVGPSRDVSLSALIGHAFLTVTVNAKPYECIYFIMPRVVRQHR